MDKKEGYLKEYARLYTAFTPRKKDVLPKWIEFALRLKKRRGLLVDVGCGPAELYPLAKNFGYGYLGIDSNPHMIDRAKAEKPEGDIRLANADELPLPNGSAQIVLMNMLVHSISSLPALDAILTEADRVLSRQGILILTSLNEQKTAKLLPASERDDSSIRPKPIKFEAEFSNGKLVMDAYHWSQKSLRGLMEINDFDVIPVHLISVGSIPNSKTYNMLLGFKI